MRRPEQDLVHKPLVQHLRQRAAPGVVWWHTPNGAFYGGKHNRKGIAIQGAILASLGVRPGVSDIVALHKGKFYAVELKAPGGTPTEAQLTFINDVNREGGFACICEGLDRALKVLETWGLLRGVAA